MDSGEECSKSNLEEGKDEKRIERLEKMMPFDANRAEINGELGAEEHSKHNFLIGVDRRGEESIGPIASPSLEPRVNGDGIGAEQKGELSPKSTRSSLNSNLEVSSPPSKGYGLKKWRRIRRDSSKDASAGVDSSQILKRRLSLNEPSKAREDDNKMKDVVQIELETPTSSVGFLQSVEAVEGAALDPELVQLVAIGGFAIGADSDNSEDRSNKSSVAASVPKLRHEIGFGRERGRTKNVGGRGAGRTKNVGGREAGNAPQQRSQRGRGSGVDASKKAQEDRVTLEKENSQSSVESDLRSSKVGFLRWGSIVSNGKQSEKSLNFDGENGDEAETCEEVRSAYYKENGVVEDLLRGDLDPDLFEEEHEVKRIHFRPPSGIDPFVESIVMLQAAQEALETEIQKIGEIRKTTEINDLDDQSEGTEVSSSPTLEAHILELNQKIEHLQYKLEGASVTVKAKELKVLELEDIINRAQLPKKEISSANAPILEAIRDLEFELEELLKKKIQTEVEFLVITRTTESRKILAEDQIALLEEQKYLAGDQAQMVLKLRDAEDKVIKLKKQAEELEAHCKELLGTERVLKLQNKASKFSFFCFIQLLLLCVAFGLFLIQLMPPSHEIVPT